MCKSALTATALLFAAALPLTMATSASAQTVERGPAGGGGAARGGAVGGGGAGGAIVGGGGGGGGFRGGMVGGGGGGGAFRGGTVERGPAGGAIGAAPRIGAAPSIGAGPRVAAGAARPGWSGPRPGWDGRRHYGRRFIGPGIGFGTGLLLGGAYAASPYYYGDADYYDYPYDTGYVDSYVYGDAAPSSDADSYCRQRYRSYDPATRTYLNNDGNRYPCP